MKGIAGLASKEASPSTGTSAPSPETSTRARHQQMDLAEVRAALAIQRALAELNRDSAGSGRPELVARIGIESGAVVVDAAGEIFGDAPNLAARVQALGEPGAVMVTARVQRQTAGLFVAEDRGAHVLKGAPEPTTLFRIVRARAGGGTSAPAPSPRWSGARRSSTSCASAGSGRREARGSSSRSSANPASANGG
jgi:class 3 adenylate cyclase